jgi:hypothetical protein
MIVRAGDLHDVGKLGIPDSIITKAGPLSEREWEFMRQHTVMGERIIAAAGPSLERIAPLVRASHERWDGRGYPDGLAGEEIPLGARIITICDSFRALRRLPVRSPAGGGVLPHEHGGHRPRTSPRSLAPAVSWSAQVSSRPRRAYTYCRFPTTAA